MRTEDIEFVSEGDVVRGVIQWPDRPGDGPPPVIIGPPNWGTRGSPVARLYHEDLTAAGFAVVTFDYRGWGASGGASGWLRPAGQREDIHNAITYVMSRTDLDGDRLSLWGLGITGGNSAVVAADDERVRAVTLQSPIADIGAWVREMYAGRDWAGFRARLDEDARDRLAGGEGGFMDPSADLMGSPAERAAANMPVAGATMRLGSADHLMRLRAVDSIHRIAPRPVLLISVPADDVTREHHALALFERAGAPKQLVRIHNVSHYEQYRVARELHVRVWIDWLQEHGVGPARSADEIDFGREPTPSAGADGSAAFVTTLRQG